MKLCILFHIGYDNNIMLQFYKKLFQQIISNQKYFFDIYIYISNELNFNKIKEYFTNLDFYNNIYFKQINNIGADCYSYLDFILNYNNNYDYILKFHTKKLSYWSYLLNSIFMDLDELINIFENNDKIGIIGHNRYLQPFYHGLSKNYKLKLQELLKLFNVEEDINIDYLKILNEKYTNFQSKKYYEYRPDFVEANLKESDCAQHFFHHKHTELNHSAYDINSSNIVKFIAGTIFMIRGNILSNIKHDFSEKLLYLKKQIETHENIKYYSNFDHNGNVFRYTNALEYILQGCIYNYKYKVYGYDKNVLLNNSLQIKNLRLPPFINNTNKQKILFVSNELSKTGAPLVLKNVISKCKEKYEIFIVSNYGGDDINAFKELVGKDNVFIIYKEKRELGFENFFEISELFKKICNIINPNIVYLNTLVSVSGIYGCYDKKRKIILHVHEAESEIINLYNDNIIVGYDFMKYVDYSIFVNDRLKDLFSSISGNILNENNSSVIFNDINIVSCDINFQIMFNKNPNKLLIGGIGSICSRKGFDIFLKIANNYDCFDFIWASNNDYNGALPTNMKIVHLKNEEMRHFYKNIDFLLYTSNSEAFPLSFWECLLCEKFVLASNKTIPLKNEIFNNAGITLLDGYSSYDLFVSFLEQLKQNKVFIDNSLINIDYIRKICSNNTKRILDVIQSSYIPKKIELILPEELQLYDRLTIYDKFKAYNLQKDLLLHQFTKFNGSINHFIHHGYLEGRSVYKFPCLIKKRIVFCLHELSHNGATRVVLDIASNLQPNYDVIIISWNNGDMIKQYTFENKPIIISYRNFEYDIVKYLDRVELASKILNELNPDLVYVNCSVTNDFYHASCSLNIPNIYHHHDGIIGYNSQLGGKQIPIQNFLKYYQTEKSLLYSASKLTTTCMVDMLGVKNKDKIKEFQVINYTNIDNLKNNSVENLKINNKKIIGMVGHTSHRKGYDIFISLSKIFKEYTFCWVGCNIDKNIEINDNLILIKYTDNPYAYMKQFDYMLTTSREDIFGLIIIESLYLNIQTILLKKSHSTWNIFQKYGAHCIDGEYSIELFQNIIKNINNYTNNIISSSKIKEGFHVGNLDHIVNDINSLTDSQYIYTSTKLKKYLYYEQYGYITYNFNKIEDIIKDFHKVEIYNYEIYKSKYKDLNLVCKTEMDYFNHWNKIGKFRRNMVIDDWKLYIAMNPELLCNGIDNEQKLIDNNINYKNTQYKFHINNYKNSHFDLKHMTNSEGLLHFIHNGCYEGRLCY